MKYEKKRVYQKYFFAMLCFMILLFAKESAYAAEKTGSIQITLNDINTLRENVSFTVYKVGNWEDTSANWKLDDKLSDTQVCLDTLKTASQWEMAATTLAKQTNLANLNNESGKTDENGKLKFSDLEWGMYLLVQTGGTESYGIVSSSLIPIPYVVDGEQMSDRTVMPKASLPQTPSDNGNSGNDGNTKDDVKSDTKVPTSSVKKDKNYIKTDETTSVGDKELEDDVETDIETEEKQQEDSEKKEIEEKESVKENSMESQTTVVTAAKESTNTVVVSLAICVGIVCVAGGGVLGFLKFRKRK